MSLVTPSHIQTDTNQWKLLKTIAADAPGTFSNETDWAGTNVVPTTGLDSIPSHKRLSSSDLVNIQIFVVALDGAGALVNRGTMSWAVQGVYVVRRRHGLLYAEGSTPPLPADTAVDSAPNSTNVTLNREIRVAVRSVGEFTTRFSSFANVPGTAEELLVFWRPE